MRAKIILIMGVSSSGKSTIGEMLATHLQWPFFDGDAFHPPENKEKMRRGEALGDGERLPWLQSIRSKIVEESKAGRGAIFTCSALKQAYRDLLLKEIPDCALVFLTGSAEVLEQRASNRLHEYMPASLLPSQLAALEAPRDAIIISVDRSKEETFAQLLTALA